MSVCQLCTLGLPEARARPPSLRRPELAPRRGPRAPALSRGPGASVLTEAPLSAQEVLENLKDRWYQADNPPSDLLLTEDEFLSFLHPEHSRGMLKFMVKEIVRDLGEAPPMALAPQGGGGGQGQLGWRAGPVAPAATLLPGAGQGVSEAVWPPGEGRSGLALCHLTSARLLGRPCETYLFRVKFNRLKIR